MIETEVNYQEGEQVTMSLERYEELRNKIDELDAENKGYEHIFDKLKKLFGKYLDFDSNTVTVPKHELEDELQRQFTKIDVSEQLVFTNTLLNFKIVDEEDDKT